MRKSATGFWCTRWMLFALCLLCMVAVGGDITWSDEVTHGLSGSSASEMTRWEVSPDFWAGSAALYIVDAGRHWVFAIDRAGSIVWSAGKYGELGEVQEGLLGVPSFVQVTKDTIVVADAAQGVIVEYTASGQIYRMVEVGNLLPVEENIPEIRSAFKTGPSEFLLADRNLHVVRRLVGNAAGEEPSWEVQTSFGTVGKSGKHNYLYSPAWAKPLRNGHIAIADSLNHRVIEADGSGNVVRQHGNDAVGTVRLELDSPTCVDDVGDGQFLICDTGNRRIIQVNSSGDVIWELREIQVPRDVLLLSPVLPLIEPIHAVRLESGSTLITDRMLRDIYEVNAAGELVWSYSLFRLKFPELPALDEPWMAIPGPVLLP